MERFLPILLAHAVALQYKFHSIHTSARGEDFLTFHPLMNKIYKLFWDDQIDRIKERALILWFDTPSSLSKLLAMCWMEELETVPCIEKCYSIVIQDLMAMEQILNKWIELSQTDLVTQNHLIDFNDAVGKFRWKLQMTVSACDDDEVLPPVKK
jgi:DNA-binding ferritin-like protein